MKKREVFEKRLVKQFMKLLNKADLDYMIYGNSHWEFTDRKIELIDPRKVKYHEKIIRGQSKLTKNQRSQK